MEQVQQKLSVGRRLHLIIGGIWKITKSICLLIYAVSEGLDRAARAVFELLKLIFTALLAVAIFASLVVGLVWAVKWLWIHLPV